MIDPRSERAQYRQLADILRGRITSGQLQPGDRLPSESRLEQEYGISRETIRRALRLLRDEGLVVTEQGYGTRVREPEERELVKVPRGARLVARPATADERDELGIERGDPGWVVVVTVGGRPRRYVADRTEFGFA